MAKYFYHIPLQNALDFIKKDKAKLNRLTENKKELEYHKLLGKSYYYLQIESFLSFFKIDKNLGYALKTIEYFNSVLFLDELCKSINFSQFKLEQKQVHNKDLFYAFCYLYIQYSSEDFENFMQKTFLHYHTAFNQNTTTKIDHKEMCQTLLKSKKMTVKESFGEDDKGSFFKILIDDKVIIYEKGKVIKTLRKKVYKNLFYYLLDLDEKNCSEQNFKVF